MSTLPHGIKLCETFICEAISFLLSVLIKTRFSFQSTHLLHGHSDEVRMIYSFFVLFSTTYYGKKTTLTVCASDDRLFCHGTE